MTQKHPCQVAFHLKFLNIDIFCNPLTAIISSGISNSSFDKGLKLADVILVHKADVTTDKKNYRNVSLLPVVSKNFEKNYANPVFWLYRNFFESILVRLL